MLCDWSLSKPRPKREYDELEPLVWACMLVIAVSPSSINANILFFFFINVLFVKTLFLCL